ncbi:TonB-dependent receptor [Aquisediminimonas sediminicola]|uniref:TonB-dependent receptor n=1 Tax=Alteraquisediminimonas sediminicola TaxID=2676787 RepID=UPI001C8DEDBC|nr:TonB-dependent receptor [Aquisediminimonas sediminicola]
MNNKMKKYMYSGIFSIVAAAVAVPAMAEVSENASNDNAGDIIVTAQRRSESIMKVPVAITALTNEALTQQGITQTSNLSGAAPSLQVNSPFGDTQPNFTIRGIGVGNEYTANQASPVGIYTDDAYIAARAGHGMQIFDLERVEILRGPQGTLYGRNTTGGAINFISVKPSLSGTKGYGQLGYGNFNSFSAQAAFETTLSEGISGLRVAVNYAKADGYVKNLYPSEEDANSIDTLAGRAILRLAPNDKLDITLKVTASHANPTQAAVIGLGMGPNDKNLVQGYSRAERGLGFWQVEHPRIGYNPTDAYGSQLTVAYELDDALTLTSMTSYDHVKQGLYQEGSGTRPGNFNQLIDTGYVNTFNMFNQELRLSYSRGDTNIQGGLYYGYDKDHNHSNAWLFDGYLMLDYQYNQVRKSTAAFAQIDQKLGDHLGVTAGLRYTMDRSRYKDFYAQWASGAGYTGERDLTMFDDPSTSYFLHGSYANGAIVTEAPLKQKTNRLTGRAAINYTFDSGAMVYASYSRGYRAGAFCGGCVTTPTVETAKPEKVDAYELGAKGRFLDGALDLSAAAFWMDYQNQQLSEIVGVDTHLRNAPKSRIRGVEVESLARLTDKFRAKLQVSVLEAEYRKLDLTAGFYGLQNLKGNAQPFAPKLTVNAGFDWDVANLGVGVINFAPTVIYTSKIYFTPYNDVGGNERLHEGKNAKVNAQLSWTGGPYTARLWVNNLLKRKSYVYGLDLRQSFGFDYLVPGAPRTFGASVRYAF